MAIRAQLRRRGVGQAQAPVKALRRGAICRSLAVERGAPAGEMARIDPVQTERALVNLIENAQRFSDPEPVTTLLRYAPPGAIIRVVDRGPGIPREKLERIFDPFVTLDQGPYHSGSGLGLAIARGFLESNGGTVRAESLPGQGATFVIEIPVGEEAPVAG